MEARERFATTDHRQWLFEGLTRAIALLRAVGCRRIWLDGGYATAKVRPGDFDVAWDITGIDWDRIDPIFLDFSDERAAQKARFGGEFFPADAIEIGSGKTFLEFFQ